MESVILQLKVGSIKSAITIPTEELVQYTIKLDPDETGGTDFALPGLENPKFIAIVIGDYQRNLAPVEVMLKGTNGDPIACMPFAVFTADTLASGDNVGGMLDTNFSGVPVLHFNNGTEASVTVHVIAGE